MKRKGALGFTMIELLVCVAVLVLIILGIGGCVSSCVRSEGDLKGSLAKFSNKGLMFKTWEGEIVKGGLKQTMSGGMQANTWEFSIRKDNPNRDEIIKQLQEAFDSDAIVHLKYKQRLWTWDWQGDTDYDIVYVKLLTNTPAATIANPPLENRL
jgi:prepilin-type N-terminal cleavage/methylation domain-containing protein